MRRVVLLATLMVATLSAAGCAGADGRRAQELLAQSDQALAQVESFRFSGRLWMETPAGDFALTKRGAVNGDSSSLVMGSDDIPGMPEMRMIVRGGTAWVQAGDGWQSFPVPPGQATGPEQFDFSPYVKDVEVDESQDVAGEPAVKVTGVLDTGGLFEGVLGQLGALGGDALPDISESLGDTRVGIYLAEATSIPLRTLVDLSLEVEGEQADIHLDFAITGVNEPVKIPQPRG
jgi:hypothetical protein